MPGRMFHAILVSNVIHIIRRRLAAAKWYTEAAILLSAAWALTKLVPFRFWRGSLGAINDETATPSSHAVTSATIEKAQAVSRWIRQTANSLPFKPVCLPRAMAGRWMLSRRGIANQIYVGARKGEGESQTDFHAWLKHGDLCLTGKSEMEQFQAFGKSGSTSEA